ncbi:hypothetical protein Dsin_023921 [Dipteronia sinensis]|uniref:RRM domain-containing protein n=1 Tax=Dipteronia sinensis TaxID=43782 RepID=A0AAE0A5P7_9ROSI|nr:hypothetical protein Dsin_023921 [Dipteronia sinensis]
MMALTGMPQPSGYGSQSGFWLGLLCFFVKAAWGFDSVLLGLLWPCNMSSSRFRSAYFYWLVYLWGLIKPFGKVRDIFLSKEKSFRRSRFAFVRFETVEEAIKVAKTTDGMHVYGWPIVTKVATYGWSSRNVKVEN